MTISIKNDLDEFIITNWLKINAYIDTKMEGKEIPFYTSVDIRESREKYAPVDNNLYPAGFNNLCLLDLDATTKQIEKFIPESKKSIAILIESNTKNKFYLENIFFLKKAIEESDKQVTLISFDQSLFENNSTILKLETASMFQLSIHQAYFKDNHIFAEGIDENFDLVIINHDQSSAINIDWSVNQTPSSPNPQMGWFNRQKIIHFQAYEKVVHDFCEHFDIDENLLQAKFKKVYDVDFSSKNGFEKLANEVDRLKETISSNQKIFIKASKGTYGMGIQVVDSGSDILNLNRKKRNKLDIGKNKIKFTDVLVQEGIETVLNYDEMPAEITIYLVGGKSVGGFMRTNNQKSASDNLNTKGMIFKKFCISEIRQNRDDVMKEAVYSIIGRLSCLASIEETRMTLEN